MIFLDDLRSKAAWNYGECTERTMLKALITDGTFAMACYRLMSWSHRWRIAPLTVILSKVNALFGQCIIGRGAQFGPGFVLIHSQGVVINGSVVGGENIRIEHQVTIGAEKDQSPRLGNNIFIGAGAKIIGPVTIGDGARIGANAVVVKDVPPGVTVGGIPARILRLADGSRPASEPE